MEELGSILPEDMDINCTLSCEIKSALETVDKTHNIDIFCFSTGLIYALAKTEILDCVRSQ